MSRRKIHLCSIIRTTRSGGQGWTLCGHYTNRLVQYYSDATCRNCKRWHFDTIAQRVLTALENKYYDRFKCVVPDSILPTLLLKADYHVRDFYALDADENISSKQVRTFLSKLEKLERQCQSI